MRQQSLVLSLHKGFINEWAHRSWQVLVEVLVQDVVVITNKGLDVVKPCSQDMTTSSWCYALPAALNNVHLQYPLPPLTASKKVAAR